MKKFFSDRFKTRLQFFLIIIVNFSSCEKNVPNEDNSTISQIFFSSRRWWNYDIFVTDSYGSFITQITKNKYIDFKPTISFDGKKLAFVSDRSGNREIFIADINWLDGHSKWTASNLLNITNSIENDWTPNFSPISNKIVYSTYFPQNDNYDIYIMNYDGSQKENLTNTASYEKFPQFSPDGSFIIYQGWQKGKMEIFFTSLLDRNRVNLTRSISSNDIISHGNAFSPDGQLVVFTSDRDGNRDIYLMNTNGDNQQQITEHSSDDYEPSFSSDGQSIVFTSERDGNKEIYIYDLVENKIRNLTKNSGDDWNPRFFNDSEKVIFQSKRDGNWEIYSMKSNGSHQRNLSNHSSTDYSYVVVPLARH